MMVHKMMRQWKKGFSLAEVLVVVAIMAILASVSAPAIIKMRDQLRQTELDAKAQQIFTVAQNQLYALKASGQILREADKIYLGGKDLPSENYVPSDLVDSFKADCYVVSDNSSFSWMNNTAFAPSLMKGDGAGYAIEYNSNSYMIYSVFYWEAHGGAFQLDSSFDYSKLTQYNIYDGKEVRGDKSNRQGMLGYYGGQITESDITTKDFNFGLTFENDDELKIIIKNDTTLLADDVNIINNIVYDITVTSNTQPDSTRVYTFGVTNGSVDNLKKTFPDISVASEPDGESVFTGNASNGYSLLLDSYMISKHFANSFPALIAGDDVKITVVGYANSGSAVYRPITKSIVVNSLFGGVRNYSDTVSINNGRHLQNLAYEASNLNHSRDVWGEPNSELSANPVKKAVLNSDIDWEKYDASNSTWGKQDNINFFPISNSLTGLMEFNGRNKAIKNLKVAGAKQRYAGLFGYMQCTNPNEQIIIKNLKLINPSVNGENFSSAGALIGTMYYGGGKKSVIKNCGIFIENSKEDYSDYNNLYNTHTVTGGMFAGGLAGIVYGVSISDSFASTKVSATTKNAMSGGLVGWAEHESEIYSSYSGGHTVEGEFSESDTNVTAPLTGTAGGLVGSLDKGCKIDSSYSTCSVKASVVGEIVGVLAEQNAITNSYFLGAAYALGTGTPNNFGCTEDMNQLKDGIQLNSDASTTYAYDTAYLGDNKTAFPGISWIGTHYGDWYEEPAAMIGFVYFEKYRDGSFGFWSNNDETNLLLADNEKLDENNSKEIVLDGYGFLGSEKLSVQYVDGNNKTTLTSIPVANQQTLYYLPWSEISEIYTADKSFSRSLELYVKGVKRAVYYNPHFAKAIYDSAEEGKNPADNKIIVRTARQLYELANEENIPSNGKNPYWSGLWTIQQQHDIECDSNITEYSSFYKKDDTQTILFTQGVIGLEKKGSSKKDFATTYDAGIYENQNLIGAYKIKNLTMSDSVLEDGANSISLFRYIDGSGKVLNLDLYNSNIISSKEQVAGLAVYNEGEINNVRIINPYLCSENLSGSVAGLVYENLGEITQCYVMPEQQNGTYNHQYQNTQVSDNTYTHAMIVSANSVAGFVTKNTGNIEKCASIGTVTCGNSAIRGTVNANGGTGKASGFVDSNNGLIKNSYSNCYVAAGIASGFANSNGENETNATIENCYALRRVVSTGTGTINSASGFAYKNSGTIQRAYAAVTTAASSNYAIDNYKISEATTFAYDISDILYPFLKNANTTKAPIDCTYMEWDENRKNSLDAVTGKSYKEFIESKNLDISGFVYASEDSEVTETFSTAIPKVYPFPMVADMTAYGDWPSGGTNNFSTEMVYYEVYKNENEYSIGMYNDDLDIHTLKNKVDLESNEKVYMDGYALLFEETAAQTKAMQDLLNGQVGNEQAYVSWSDNRATDGDNNTKSSSGFPLFSISDLMYKADDNKSTNAEAISNNVEIRVPDSSGNIVEKGEIDGLLEITMSKITGSTTKNYYFRMLPAAAVMTNTYVDSNTRYQLLNLNMNLSTVVDEGMGLESSAKIQMDKRFYYCPYFAKSKIVSSDNATGPITKPTEDSSTEFVIRTVRQLCSLSINNLTVSNTYSFWYNENRKYIQDLDIEFTNDAGEETYTRVYGKDSGGSPILINGENGVTGKRDYKNYRSLMSSIGEYTSEASRAFKASYDGKGFKVSGLRECRVSMFGYKTETSISNIEFADNSFKLDTGTNGNGALCGWAKNTLLESINANDIVIESSKFRVGGITGILDHSTMKSCTATNMRLTVGSAGTNIVKDIEYRASVGTLAGTAENGSDITDCTVTSPRVINNSTKSDGYASNFGGAVGYLNSSITNLLVTDPIVESNLTQPVGSTEDIHYSTNFGNRFGGAVGYYVGGIVNGVTVSGNAKDPKTNYKEVSRVVSNHATGGFAGYINTALSSTPSTDKITNVSVENVKVVGRQSIGGFVGVISAGKISKCFAAVTVEEAASTTRYRDTGCFGGFAGSITRDNKKTLADGVKYPDCVEIKESYASGNVLAALSDTKDKNIGGFMGKEEYVTYKDPNKTVTNPVKCTISSCYASGDVTYITKNGYENTTQNYLGGFAGKITNWDETAINQNYSVGKVTKGDNLSCNIGGFLGNAKDAPSSADRIDDCYYLSEGAYNKNIATGNGIEAWSVRDFGTELYREAHHATITDIEKLESMRPVTNSARKFLLWYGFVDGYKGYPFPALSGVGHVSSDDYDYTHTGFFGSWFTTTREYYPLRWFMF